MTIKTNLTLSSIKAIAYRMPLKRAYGTARGTTRAGNNFLVCIVGVRGNDQFHGVGECQPRHKLTGDGASDRVAAWSFLCAAVDTIQDRELDFSTPEEAVSIVRGLMKELRELAVICSDESNRARPFRGTLLGIEVALLDVLAQALKLSISELLGNRRDRIEISISTISTTTGLDVIKEKVQKQVRFPMTRVKGTGELNHDIRLMELVQEANAALGRNKSIWIDINEGMDYDRASDFISRVAVSMGAARLPASVVVEGMLSKDQQLSDLPRLQKLADAKTRSESIDGSSLDLRIMPDEGLWDVLDLEELDGNGGCRAINIKAPKAGGLLDSLDLANAAVARNPDVHISLGGMIGTSDLTAWALHNLARSLPRVDYLTAVPPGNVKARISSPLASYAKAGTNIIKGQTQLGLGAKLDWEAVAPFVRQVYDAVSKAGRESSGRPSAPVAEVAEADPAVPVPGDDKLPKGYLAALSYLDGTKGLDSHCVERQFVRRGYSIRRTSFIEFAVLDERGEVIAEFSRSRHKYDGYRAAARITSRKEATKERLRLIDVPLAEGKLFGLDEASVARKYAEQLGWPVVVKPGVGTGGVGVTANIQSSEEFDRSVSEIMNNAKARARNDGTIIVEKHIDGEELRVTVVNGRALAATRKRFAHVTGDGSSTVRELMARKNEERALNPRAAKTMLRAKPSTLEDLKRQGLELTSVPEAGATVRLSSTSAVTQGGESENITDSVHPSILQAAEAAVEAIPGLKMGGVDILVANPSLAVSDQRLAVLEVNANPAISTATFPFRGDGVDVGGAIAQMVAAELGLEWPSDHAGQSPNTQVEIVANGDAESALRVVGELAEGAGIAVGDVKVAGQKIACTLSGPADASTALVGGLFNARQKGIVSEVVLSPRLGESARRPMRRVTTLGMQATESKDWAQESAALERASLMRGLDTVRLSPETFIAGNPDGGMGIGFFRTSSDRTSFAAVRTLNDRHALNGLLGDAGIKVSRARIFSKRSLAEALSFANTLCGPALIRPRLKRQDAKVRASLVHNCEIEAGVEAVVLAGPGSREFMLEEAFEGALYRFIVVGEEVVSVTRQMEGAAEIDHIADVEVSLKDLAVSAVRAVPGSGNAAVEILLEDHARPTQGQKFSLVGLDPSPALMPRGARPLSAQEVLSIADKMVVSSFASGRLDTQQPRSDLHLRIEISGRVQAVGYRRWMVATAADLGLRCEPTNQPDGTVHASVQGAADRVCALVAQAIQGPRRAMPHTVSCYHLKETSGQQSLR